MPRNRRPADGQGVGEFAHRPVTGAQQLHDRASIRVSERIEWVTGQGVERDCVTVTVLLRFRKMKEYRASATIRATPEAIWAILVDAPNYSAWESGVLRVEGRIAAGEKIKVISEVNPGRAFPVKVTEFAAPQRMTWSGGMPLGLFRGVRTFKLKPSGDGTEFAMRERYTGPLLPLIWKSMPDLGPSFEQFAKGLKQRAEGSS